MRFVSLPTYVNLAHPFCRFSCSCSVTGFVLLLWQSLKIDVLYLLLYMICFTVSYFFLPVFMSKVVDVYSIHKIPDCGQFLFWGMAGIIGDDRFGSGGLSLYAK
jgi:hypothetical protein